MPETSLCGPGPKLICAPCPPGPIDSYHSRARYPQPHSQTRCQSHSCLAQDGRAPHSPLNHLQTAWGRALRYRDFSVCKNKIMLFLPDRARLPKCSLHSTPEHPVRTFLSTSMIQGSEHYEEAQCREESERLGEAAEGAQGPDLLSICQEQGP